jgi:hypothetical protein
MLHPIICSSRYKVNHMKTTNYYNTFIEVAADCPARIAEVPPQKGNVRTAANIQFELLKENPYKYTSDDVLFQVYVEKNKISSEDLKKAREAFFSRDQACFRASPLAKRYGWGVHADSNGRIALYAVESEEYATLSRDKKLKILKAMRSKRG